MLNRLRNSPIPTWVNALLVLLVALMLLQVYWHYLDNDALLDAGMTIQGDPDQNLIYTTGARLLAMVAASIFVLITQNPAQYLVVLVMSALREAQEGIIDPLFPWANSPMSPTADFVIHVLIVAAEVSALVVVYRLTKDGAAAEPDPQPELA